MQGMHIGIDLGTTNTVIASCKQGKRFHLPTTREINQDVLAGQQGRRKSLPSVLYIDNDGKVRVGEYAKNRKRDGASSNLLYNTKIDMGTKTTYDNGFTPVRAAAEILKVCYENILTYVGRNAEFPSVTITVPASFTQDQVADTLAAAKMAGFDTEHKVSILEEPVAALYYYINRQIISGEEEIVDFSETKRVLVYDIGGGTCDVCIVDFKVNDDYDFEVHFILTNRYTEFGGNDFDEQAAIGLLNKLFQRYDIKDSDVDSDDVKNNLVSTIIPFCEQYKQQYSDLLMTVAGDDEIPDSSMIPDVPFGSLRLFLSKYENVKLDISYEEYQKFTEVFFEDNYTHPSRDLTNKMIDKNIIKPVYQLLKQLERSGERPIDCVFMTGGMSKYLPVKHALKEYCKCPIIDIPEPMDSVALGASLSKFLKSNVSGNTHEGVAGVDEEVIEKVEEVETDNRPRLAEAIFIDMYNSLPLQIIAPDTVIPTKGVVDHVFHVGSSGVCINLFAGRSVWDAHMRILYDYSVRFDELVAPGTEATISYEIDENRFLRLYLDLKDIRKQRLELTVDTY